MARRKNLKKVFREKSFSAKLRLIFKAGVFVFLVSLIAFLLLLLYFGKDLPRPERFTEKRISQPTKIYDRTGEALLYTIFGEEKRELISIDKMPDNLQNAIVALEDKKFYSHFGVDPVGILRAVLANFKIGPGSQGASTIPQQLIRSTFLSPEKTIERKVREVILSIELDLRYSKKEILEWYLNQIPFGLNAYGVEAASQTFFSKHASELTLAESALLASLAQAPSRLSPYGNYKQDLLERKDYTLDRMVAEGYISKEQAAEAKNEILVFAKPSSSIIAPHFVIYVQKYLLEKYGDDYLKTEGLKVITTLDVDLQKSGEEIVKQSVAKNQSKGAFNAALVAIDPFSGDVLTMVGSKDYFADSLPENCISGHNCVFEPEFNVATLGLRQPGSSFKPFVYVTAFEKGYNENYVLIDESTDFGIWGGKHYIPQNYDGRFRGPVTLRQALAQSLNVPSVKTLMFLATIKDSVATAEKMGISTLKDYTYYGPALVLGGGEVTLFDMTSSYGVFAADGLKVKPNIILKIEDTQGKIIEKNTPSPKRVLSSSSCQTITSILSDNQARTPVFGAHSALYINDETAVKTGTTQFYNDAWTIGYNEEIVVGVWAGNNDNSPNYNQPGVALAAPIWKQFMETAANDQ